MQAVTREAVLSAFRGASRSDVERVTFPTDFGDVPFSELDFLAWRDRRHPRRAYLVVDHPPIGLVALVLDRAATSPRHRSMCSWCQDVFLHSGAVQYSARRGRAGSSVGVMVCDDFRCSRNVRELPPAFHEATDLAAIRTERIYALRRRVASFVDRVVGEHG